MPPMLIINLLAEVNLVRTAKNFELHGCRCGEGMLHQVPCRKKKSNMHGIMQGFFFSKKKQILHPPRNLASTFHSSLTMGIDKDGGHQRSGDTGEGHACYRQDPLSATRHSARLIRLDRLRLIRLASSGLKDSMAR